MHFKKKGCSMKRYLALLTTWVLITCPGVFLSPAFGDEFPICTDAGTYGAGDPAMAWMCVAAEPFLVDSSIIYGLADKGQECPAVANGNGTCLIVWQDGRKGSMGPEIFGMRVDANGIPLDLGSIMIGRGINEKMDPVVAFNGTNYLVVWDEVVGSYFDVYGARVTQEGEVLDNIPICTVGDDQLIPSVASDGTGWLVTWLDFRNYECDVYGARISADGTVLNPTGIPISTATGDQKFTATAFGDSSYFVVWEDTRTDTPAIYGVRVTPEGEVLGPDVEISKMAAQQTFPHLFPGDSSYLVVWEYGDTFNLYGRRVSFDGVVIDTIDIPISTATGGQAYPSVGFDGTNWAVIWQDNRDGEWDIYGTRVTQGGVVLNPDGIPIHSTQELQANPFIVFNGTNYLAVWQDYRYGWYDIYGARLSDSLLPIDDMHISIAGNSQYEPEVAFNGANYLLVWSQDDERDSLDIYGIRVSGDGTILDSLPLPISTSPGNQKFPNTASDGTNYLVVWKDYTTNGIYMAMVSNSGEVTQVKRIATAPGSNSPPGVSFGLNSYLVTWDNVSSGWYDVYGTRVSQDGAILDPSFIPISTAAGDEYDVDEAFDGTNWLCVWTGHPSPGEPCHTAGTRVGTSGTVLDPGGLLLSGYEGGQFNPAITFGGGNYLVVWKDTRGTKYDYNIYGARISTSGTVIGGFIPIGVAPGAKSYPEVSYYDGGFTCVWQDARNGYYENDIYGARISESGVVTDTFTVSIADGDQLRPCVEGNLILYSSWTPIYPYNSMRIWGRFYPEVGIEETGNPKSEIRNPKLTVYPNPFTTVVSVKWSGIGEANLKVCPTIQIYDLSGRLVKTLIPNPCCVLGW